MTGSAPAAPALRRPTPAPAPALIACPDCALLQRVAAPPPGVTRRCPRCRAVLVEGGRDGLQPSLALTLTALILLGAAHAFPILSFGLEGLTDSTTLLGGVAALWRNGLELVAVLVLLTLSLVPLAKLLSSLYVLLPLRLGRVPPGAGRVFRWIEVLHPWAMIEVYLLGILVAYVKLSDLAELELHAGLLALVGLILAMIAAEQVLDPQAVWQRLGAQARAAAGRPGTVPVACPACGQIAAVPAGLPQGRRRCPRCRARLDPRRPASRQRTWALLGAAAILYIPANLLPVMTVTRFGQGEPDTILSGIQALVAAGMYPVALLVFFASITVPVLKILGLAFLLVSVERRSAWRPRDRTRLYRVIDAVGRWSMVDIFMIAILAALVNLGTIATIEPGAGATAFAAVVVLTMLAAISFDPRLIWDAAKARHDPT